MNPIILLLAAAPLSDVAAQDIIVTASREPVARAEAPASSTLIGRDQLDLLGFPLTSDVLRLVPGVAVAASGPPGSQVQVRIRGAEANHSLLFVDGIKFNDPAAGNEARFELLTNDSLARIELVRGPQSALWGSEAIGGVVAVETADARRGDGVSAIGEYGSHQSARAATRLALRSGDFAVSGSAGWLQSDGIDAFGGGGDRDGYDNRFASLKAVLAPAAGAEVGVVGHHVAGKSQYDGLDPVTFVHADTLDSTSNRITAGRVWAKYDWADSWSLGLDGSLLESSNRNRLAGAPLNSTFGRRSTFSAQLGRSLGIAGTSHRLNIAAEHERERFRARDRQYSGGTDQDRSRSLTAFAAEWRGEWTEWLVSDLAVRHDDFSDFADATNVRASLLVRLNDQWSLHAGYGQGIAQPSFYDLFGFFPGSFVGNPALKPEKSTSWETGLRWADARTSVAVTAFSARLRDEIVDVFDPATFESSTANAAGTSHRRGIEIEAERRIADKARLTLSYSWLDADEQKSPALPHVREVRRPRHSGSLAVTTPLGPVDAGASLAYVGRRLDTDFDAFPARTVSLRAYWLASLNVGWRLGRGVEAYARMENALDDRYEDAVGYATLGRTVYAGLRLRLGD